MDDTRPSSEFRAAPITEQGLMALTNTELDRLFRDSPTGDIPDGDTRGTLLAWPGTWFAKPIAVLVYLIAWQGKVFNRRQGFLKNKTTPLRLRLIKASLSTEDSWVDGRPCVLIDYSRTSFVAKMVRDETRRVSPGLYLGVVWLWRWRAGWFTVREQSPNPAG
jgi:hypothetical protein